MNNDKEIEVMTDNELKQFLSIATKMFEKAKLSKTKNGIALDQAKKLYDMINYSLDNDEYYYAWNPCPYSYADLKAAGKKVRKYEIKNNDLEHEIFYFKKTVDSVNGELAKRESMTANVPHSPIIANSELDDIFGEV